MPYDLTTAQRDRYRETSIRSQLRKQMLLQDYDEALPSSADALGSRLNPNDLMPWCKPAGLP